MEKEKLGQYLAYLGGILALVAGLSSVVYKKALLTKLGVSIFAGLTGTTLLVLGIIGIVGGLLALYGGYKTDMKITLVGGILGLFAPCILSILAIIGGYYLKK